jgi:hypothetical protein
MHANDASVHVCLPQISVDTLMGVIQRCGLQTYSPGSMSVVLSGQWPLVHGNETGLQNFEGLFELLATSAEPAIRASGRDPLHQVIYTRYSISDQYGA